RKLHAKCRIWQSRLLRFNSPKAFAKGWRGPQLRRQLAAVLLDMTMPILGGAEVLRHLKRVTPRLPVIGSSGHSEITARADLMKPGGFRTNRIAQPRLKR